MSPPASERAEPIAPHVPVTHTLRPSTGARTAQRAVPATALYTYGRAGVGVSGHTTSMNRPTQGVKSGGPEPQGSSGEGATRRFAPSGPAGRRPSFRTASHAARRSLNEVTGSRVVAAEQGKDKRPDLINPVSFALRPEFTVSSDRIFERRNSP